MQEPFSDAKTFRLAIELPRIPSIIRYHDAYSGCARIVRNPASEDVWILHCNGTTRPIDFRFFPEDWRWLMRCMFADALVGYAPNTVAGMFDTIVWSKDVLGLEILRRPLQLEPLELQQFWLQSILPELIEARRSAQPLKFYLKYLCKNNVGRLSPGDIKFVSMFPGPKKDLYASVRSSEVYLSAAEQLAIVSYLDDAAESARKGTLSRRELRDSCLVAASFQYGMRPIQIAKVKLRDVRIRVLVAGDDPIVHVRFLIEKRRDSKERTPITVKIKREWAVLYERYCAAITSRESDLTRFLFGLNPTEASTAIKGILLRILGRSRSATDLRHTAAQRLVDRGATHEELARFMGHKSQRTGLVYFSESTLQAERLNKALESSKVYSEVAFIGRNKTIDTSRLKRMSADRQIGGVPHGIPISGIGACKVGQSLCVKNPVLSCYGCQKFMPVRNAKVHRDVVEALRAVIRRFSDASPDSSAFAQLTYTVAVAERLLADEDDL